MTTKNLTTYLILPFCLLLLNAAQEIFIYKFRGMIKNNLIYVGVLVLMFAIGFTVIGNLVAPWIKQAMEKLYKNTKKRSGAVGIALFYWIVIGIIYLLYFIIYVHGPQYLLPKLWR